MLARLPPLSTDDLEEGMCIQGIKVSNDTKLAAGLSIQMRK